MPDVDRGGIIVSLNDENVLSPRTEKKALFCQLLFMGTVNIMFGLDAYSEAPWKDLSTMSREAKVPTPAFTACAACQPERAKCQEQNT